MLFFILFSFLDIIDLTQDNNEGDEQAGPNFSDSERSSGVHSPLKKKRNVACVFPTQREEDAHHGKRPMYFHYYYYYKFCEPCEMLDRFLCIISSR